MKISHGGTRQQRRCEIFLRTFFLLVSLLLVTIGSCNSDSILETKQENKKSDGYSTENDTDISLLSAWRFWWMQRLQELDSHQKHLERVLVEMALTVLSSEKNNHPSRRRQPQRRTFQQEKEWLLSVSDSDQGWKQCRRMARACRPTKSKKLQDETDGDDATPSTKSVAVEIRPTGEVSQLFESSTLLLEQQDLSNTQDLFTGMLLQVYNAQEYCNNKKKRKRTKYWRTKQDSQDDDSLPACLDELQLEQYGQLPQANTMVADVIYELLEPIHMELGLVPQHAFDYAYRPVVTSLGGEAVYPTDQGSAASTTTTNADGGKVAHVSSSDKLWQHTDILPARRYTSWWQWISGREHRSSNKEHRYEKMDDRAFAGGSHGEVWRARQKPCSSSAKTTQCHKTDKHRRGALIMKRLKVEHGYSLLEAGLREIYFGSLLEQEQKDKNKYVTVYVDHFFREVNRIAFTPKQTKKDMELWIVFEDAGPSLRSYLYTAVTSGDFVVYQHSSFWTKLRMSVYNRTTEEDEAVVAIRTDGPSMGQKATTGRYESSAEDTDGKVPPGQQGKKKKSTAEGRVVMREVLRQILTSAAFLHEHGIVHRDIKPSNVMCKSDMDMGVTRRRLEVSMLHCVLGDFSSAWDHFSSQNLYANGPSAEEQTDAYAPPEALFGPTWVPFHEGKPQSYDSWSIGVLALELLLGTPNVFSVDQRTTALLTNKLSKEGASAEEIQRALYLAALSQFCIYIPATDKSWPLRAGDPLHNAAMAKKSCTLQDFHHALRTRDPLGLGFDSSSDTLLHLIWGLLAWDPMERLTASEALRHPYFTMVDPFVSKSMVPGKHNAIESQELDPRMDFRPSEAISEFTCPKCNRTFSDWQSCHKHANSRRHAKFCTYDRSTLPTCLNAHSMLPAHPTSGYCDIQGRRRVMEDFHAVQLRDTHQYYGMFDGHTGNLASKFVASTFYDEIATKLSDLDKRVKNDPDWKSQVDTEMGVAFADIHDRFLKAVTFAPLDFMDQSGTTATILFVTQEAIVVASIGDSRAVLASNKDNNFVAIQLTLDHVASNADEKRLVESRGGFVSFSGGIDRVNGTLAVTRSIGDANLAPVLSRTPHVVAMELSELKELCGPNIDGLPCFLVLASDGLWDVMNNQESVDMVSEVLRNFDSEISWEEGGAFQEAAQLLTQEAYVRGSTDNIGVCVVKIE